MIRRETKQKEEIYKTFNKIYHPTVEQVLEELKRQGKKISRATVFRTLNVLCEEKRIKKLFFNNQPSRYDINVMEHQHFCCEKCNKIIDLDNTTLKKNYIMGNKVSSKTIVYYGVCKDCLKGERYDI